MRRRRLHQQGVQASQPRRLHFDETVVIEPRGRRFLLLLMRVMLLLLLLLLLPLRRVPPALAEGPDVAPNVPRLDVQEKVVRLSAAPEVFFATAAGIAGGSAPTSGVAAVQDPDRLPQARREPRHRRRLRRERPGVRVPPGRRIIVMTTARRRRRRRDALVVAHRRHRPRRPARRQRDRPSFRRLALCRGGRSFFVRGESSSTTPPLLR
jgi:hypothetical protein